MEAEDGSDLRFMSDAAVFLGPVDALTLEQVWSLDRDELSVRALRTLDNLRVPEMSSLTRDIVWSGQALLEFQDLQPVVLPGSGRFLKVGYALFESLALFRSSVATMLNGHFHAALAALRPALELFLFHYWWRMRLDEADDYEPFYQWLVGDERAPKFARVADEVFGRVPMLHCATCACRAQGTLDRSLRVRP
jgi:hypothetical protein